MSEKLTLKEISPAVSSAVIALDAVQSSPEPTTDVAAEPPMITEGAIMASLAVKVTVTRSPTVTVALSFAAIDAEVRDGAPSTAVRVLPFPPFPPLPPPQADRTKEKTSAETAPKRLLMPNPTNQLVLPDTLKCITPPMKLYKKTIIINYFRAVIRTTWSHEKFSMVDCHWPRAQPPPRNVE